MNVLTKRLPIIALVSLGVLWSGCSDDAASDAPAGTGKAGSSGNGTGGMGTGGTAGSGQGGSGGTAGAAGAGGVIPPACDLDATRPIEEVSGEINADKKLTSDKTWKLKGVVKVNDGATLTIDPCTKIIGSKESLGTLVIKRGAKIMAEGTETSPILFTSELPKGSRERGDWGGLIILGRAPNNESGEPSIEGLTTDEAYGGNVPNDNSGTLRYVRIEFSGVEIGEGNEINGLTLGSVGSGTTIDHVMVSNTLDDCFEFFGGTVNASHLVCNAAGDDMFDADEGYIGKLQFLFGRQANAKTEDPNGFECDNDKTNLTVSPRTNPTIYNATLVGLNKDAPNQQYGALFRRGFQGTFGNILITGFEGGVDIRNAPETSVTMSGSIFFNNAPENIAYAEDGSNDDTQKDDDGGFDERNWFTKGQGNSTNDPGLAAPFALPPNPVPAAALTGVVPPSSGFFDTTANYVGAFKPGTNWMTGSWIAWEEN